MKYWRLFSVQDKKGEFPLQINISETKLELLGIKPPVE
jgi:hypothetical protein